MDWYQTCPISGQYGNYDKHKIALALEILQYRRYWHILNFTRQLSDVHAYDLFTIVSLSHI